MKVWISAIVLLAAGLAGLYWFVTRTPAQPAGGGWQMPPPAVEAQPVEIGQVVRTVEAVGTLRANESVVVSSEIAGRIDVNAWPTSAPPWRRLKFSVFVKDRNPCRVPSSMPGSTA